MWRLAVDTRLHKSLILVPTSDGHVDTSLGSKQAVQPRLPQAPGFFFLHTPALPSASLTNAVSQSLAESALPCPPVRVCN